MSRDGEKAVGMCTAGDWEGIMSNARGTRIGIEGEY